MKAKAGGMSGKMPDKMPTKMPAKMKRIATKGMKSMERKMK